MFSMLKKLCLCLLAFFTFTAVHAQTKYWVFFTDKANAAETFDPYMYFHKNALDRRQKSNLPLTDYTDLPVNRSYIFRVNKLADSLGNESRWFNAVGVWASEENIKKISALPFVKKVQQ